MSLEAVPIESDKEVYALAVINTVFGGSISSRLFQENKRRKRTSIFYIFVLKAYTENVERIGYIR